MTGREVYIPRLGKPDVDLVSSALEAQSRVLEEALSIVRSETATPEEKMAAYMRGFKAYFGFNRVVRATYGCPESSAEEKR